MAFQPIEHVESVAEPIAERDHSDWRFGKTKKKKKEKRFLLSTVLDTGSGKPLEPVAVVSVIAPI